MKHPHFLFGRTFCLAGLLVALSLGIIGSCSLRHVAVPLAEIERMDEKRSRISMKHGRTFRPSWSR